MRKWSMMLLALLLAATPQAGMAQDLPELFTEVYESIGEGLAVGVQAMQQAQPGELTLSLKTDGERLEAGKTMDVTITAGNPFAHETQVSFELALPEHVTADTETTWTAVLPAAGVNEETGEAVPSETVITKRIALDAGADSAQAEIQCEMSMGTRFYRAETPLKLCVPKISASAQADGTQEGRLNPGDTFAYRVTLENAGDAPKELTLEMTLPETAALCGELPQGFAQEENRLHGRVLVPAAQGEAAECVELVFPMQIAADALKDDADAQRLIAPTISLDAERVPAPRIQVCGPRIQARLMTDCETLETGEEATLSVVVINSGLAEADVKLRCVLPQGLSLADDNEDKDGALLPDAQGDDQLPGAGEAIPVEDEAAEPVMQKEDRTLVFDLHMDAAKQTADGVIAHTQVIEIPVRAQIAQSRMTQQALGAALAWSVNEETAQLGEAVAVNVRPQTVLGLTRADWNGVFWAGVLLLVAMICLYAAMKKEKREEDYCFE